MDRSYQEIDLLEVEKIGAFGGLLTPKPLEKSSWLHDVYIGDVFGGAEAIRSVSTNIY